MSRAERIARAITWRILAARCEWIMRTRYGSHCARPRDHRNPFHWEDAS